MIADCVLKHPFKRNFNEEQSEAAASRRLARLPYKAQILRGTDWVTLGGADTIAALMGIVSNCDNYARRILNRNTIVAAWEPGEKAGQQ